MHQILHDTPARRADYVDVTGSATFPLPFYGTRWVEDEKVAVRAINIWTDVCQLYRFWQSLSKSKRPSSKSYLTVQDATIEPLILAKLHFFAHVCGILKPFLTLYQCVKPMMPFLYDDLRVPLREIASKFVLQTVLDECKTGVELCDIDYNDKKKQLAKVGIGFGADKVVTDLLGRDEVSNDDIKTFRSECLQFLVSLTCKIVERSPVKYAVVRNAKSIDPEIVSDTTEGEEVLQKFCFKPCTDETC